MTLDDAMRDACHALGIVPPQRLAPPGKWAKTPVQGKARSNRSGRVMLFDDGKGGVAFNWVTGQKATFRVDGARRDGTAPARDLARERQREAEREAERKAVAALCEQIVARCAVAEHPYLVAKGFSQERGLVIERDALPAMPEATRRALPEGDGPILIVPGRIGKALTTVQFIDADGVKKNILGGVMGGACHRIATGRETWVCEGIATALSVRAALRLLGRSATVLSAFSASNVAAVAREIRGAVIAADHDRPLAQFGGQGTGEYWARSTGLRWLMPPEPGDFNDWHQATGLREVAMLLRTVPP